MSSSTDWTFGFKPGVGGSGAAGRAAVMVRAEASTSEASVSENSFMSLEID
jgi:hypothetical protein